MAYRDSRSAVTKQNARPGHRKADRRSAGTQDIAATVAAAVAAVLNK